MVFALLVVPTFCLPKDRLVGFKVAIGPTPVPVRLTCCGLPPALSVMLIFAERFPLAVGVNVTLNVQLAPTATEVPQSCFEERCVGWGLTMARIALTKMDGPVCLR